MRYKLNSFWYGFALAINASLIYYELYLASPGERDIEWLLLSVPVLLFVWRSSSRSETKGKNKNIHYCITRTRNSVCFEKNKNGKVTKFGVSANLKK